MSKNLKKFVNQVAIKFTMRNTSYMYLDTGEAGSREYGSRVLHISLQFS